MKIPPDVARLDQARELGDVSSRLFVPLRSVISAGNARGGAAFRNLRNRRCGAACAVNFSGTRPCSAESTY
jgi:hypothetical protein